MGLECQPGRTVIKLENLDFGDELLKHVHKDTSESSEEFGKPQHIDKTTIDVPGGGDGMISDGISKLTDEVNGLPPGEDEDGGGNEREDRDDDEVIDEAEVEDLERKRAMRLRRSHMNFQAQKDESCQVCVCSVEGKDEYCSRRPAMNVNECIRMADIMENFQQNVPFNVESVLAYRIRRGQGGSAVKDQGLWNAGDS